LQEEDLRRDYRKNIDEYHKGLKVMPENPREKAQRLREKIRQEAEEVEMHRRHDLMVKRERAECYKEDLGDLVKQGERYRGIVGEREDKAEREHKGLPIYGQETKRGCRLEELKVQVIEKEQLREKMRQLDSKPGVNDFLQYKDGFDDKNCDFILDFQEPKEAKDNRFAQWKQREMQAECARKAQKNNEERRKDWEMVKAQEIHEQRCIQEEIKRKAMISTELRGGLENQIHNREYNANADLQEGRAFRNTFNIGEDDHRHRNYDLSNEIRMKNERLARERYEERSKDARNVGRLDEFDHHKMAVEQAKRDMFKQNLANTLDEQV